jgi:hypothetical protein
MMVECMGIVGGIVECKLVFYRKEKLLYIKSSRKSSRKNSKILTFRIWEATRMLHKTTILLISKSK